VLANISENEGGDDYSVLVYVLANLCFAVHEA